MATGATGFGVINTGFYAKPLSVITDEIDQDLRTILGESAGTNSDGTIPTQSMAGQLKSLLVDGFGAQWDLLEAAYAAVDPNKNSGASQDAIAAISGTVRLAAQYSVATGICAGTALTVLTAGRVVTVAGTNARFDSLVDKTLATGTAWAGTTVYTAGDIRTNNSQIFRCSQGGTSAASPGPSGVGASISDGLATWRYCGEGVAFAVVPFKAEDVGAVGALAGSMTGIATPVDGWKTVINPLDAQVGQARETDSAFRKRRDLALSAAGNATVDTIRANILAVNQGSTDPSHTPPTSCSVLFNNTDFVDVNGLPAHSVEIIVLGGTDADIAQAVWDSVGGGTYTYGSTTATVTDSQGNSQTVRYTRPTQIPIWVTATVKYDQGEWPANSDSVVAQACLSALLTATENWPMARDVRQAPLVAAIMRGPAQTDSNGNAIVPADSSADPVPGLLEVDSLYFGSATGPTGSAQIVIADYQIATFSSANMNITASTETP